VPIPSDHAQRYLYHFTHIDNLPNLLKRGFLANNHKDFPKSSHRSVAAASIQARRAEMAVTCEPGGRVHDYVPLYFGCVSPMLLSVINAKNVDQMDILYFEFPISLLNGDNAVFTDASANTVAPPRFFNNPSDLIKLNWTEIDSKKWSSASEKLRHERMAEALVRDNLPITAASRCVVWNDDVKSKVEQIAGKNPFPPIDFESPGRYHWFTNFAEGGKSSLVAGPRQIARTYHQTCKDIDRERGQHHATAKFKNKAALLNSLRANFGCLPQTAELVDLKSANSMHKYTVDVHTKMVVANLLSLDEFKNLDSKARDLVEIAAYLHDIGKGPKSRWANNGGIQKVDPNHPVGAMPMMADIFTRQVGKISEGSGNTITKLVCYHDLVGDVLGRGRDRQQVVDVADNVRELEMLFAIGKADATALSETWWNEKAAEELHDWCVERLDESSG
jgi:hypothetical protein